MVKITFVQPGGEVRVIDAAPGQTVMEAGTKCGVEGIIGECGGNCACGTCRILPDPAWADRLEPITEIEAEMLDFCGIAHSSARLACRIAVTEALDGLKVMLPESQY